MRTKSLVWTLLFLAVLSGCASRGTKFDELYSAEEAQDLGVFHLEIEDPNFHLLLQESPAEQEPFMGVFGNDGANIFHELKGYSLEWVFRVYLSSISVMNIEMVNESDFPEINLNLETSYDSSSGPSVQEIYESQIELLQDIFNVEIYQEKIPTEVYVFSLDDSEAFQAGQVELGPRFVTSAGWASGGLISNYNDRAQESYHTFDELLWTLKYGDNFQFINHISESGAYALPYSVGDMNFEEKIDYLLNFCGQIGVSYEIQEIPMDTWMVKFNNPENLDITLGD